MKKNIGLLFLLLLNLQSFAQIPAGYYDPAAGLTGDELKSALYNIIKGHTEYPYTSTSTDVWDILKDTDEDTLNANNVILLYTGWSVDAEQEYNSGNGWSREHVWAKSRGDFGTDPGPGTDTHHLRPADVSVNSARNNRWFAECDEQYFDEGGTIPTDSWTSSTEWVWKPRDAVKGDVARMIFYMATRYEGEYGEPDLEVVDYLPPDTTILPIHALLTDLLAWHYQDPVSDWERNRNDIIYYNYQGNRNPYIDHPEWVCEVFDPNCSIDDPENFTAVGTTATQIDLSWDLNTNSDDVLLAWNTTNTFGTPSGTYSVGNTISGGGTVLYIGNGTSYSHTGLSQQRYYYKLWSYDASPDYSLGVEADATPLMPEPTNDPLNFIVTGTTTTSIDLSWTDATGGTLPSAYLIKASTGIITDPVDGIEEADGTYIKNIDYGTEAVSFTGLSPSTTYYFKIYPYTNAGTTTDYKTDSPGSTSGTTDALLSGIICEQDFDLNTDWEYSCDVAFFDNNWGVDGYFGIIDIADADPLDYINLSQNILGENDLDDEGNGTSGTATIDFADADISSYMNVIFSFDWDISGYNYEADEVRYELFYDGISQGIEFLFEGSETTPDGEGTFSTEVPDNVNTFDFKLYIDDNGADGFSGYDNFTLEGEIPPSVYIWQGDDPTYPNDWQTAENWNYGSVPESTIDVIIPETENYPIIDEGASVIICQNMEIQSGAHITIASTGKLTVISTLTNNNGAEGIIIKSDAGSTGSLIHSTSNVPATCERYLSADNWHYFFSPLDNVPLDSLTLTSSGSTNQNFYWYNESNEDYWDVNTIYGTSGWTNETANVLNTKFGYIHFSPEERTYELTGGNLQAEDKSFSLDYTDNGTGPVGMNGVTSDWDNFEGWNLVGNPYASAIDWENSEIDKSNIEDVVYYYDDQTDQYKYYGSGTVYNQGITVNGGSRYIPANQAFFVKATRQGNFTVPNNARVHNDQTYWKNSDDPRNTARLQIEYDDYFDETVIRAINNDLLDTYDKENKNMNAYKMFSLNGSKPQLYSMNIRKDKLFALNTINATAGKRKIPVGVYTGKPDNYTIRITNNTFPKTHIWLEDCNLNKKINLLKEDHYSFYQTEGNDNSRFILHADTNEPPKATGSINDQIAYVDIAFTLDLSNDLFEDDDFDDVLTYGAHFYSLNSSADWLNFNESEMKLYGTPYEEGIVNIKLRASDIFGAYDDLYFSVTVNSNDASSIHIADEGIHILPNPANDFFFIETNENVQYRIISAEGRILRYGSISNTDKINISEFSSGIYFIEISNSEQTVRKKLIKK